MDGYLASLGFGSARAPGLHDARVGGELVVSDDVRRLVTAVGQLIQGHLTDSSAPLLVGIGGGPGAGKTTLSVALAGELANSLSAPRVLRLSLEDFYLSKEERFARGHRWRAVPGTHDMERALRVTRALRSERSGVVTVPRFDMATGAAKPQESVDLPVAVCILEGWLIGYDDGPYGELGRLIDVLIFLDAETSVLREGRFRREHTIRVQSRGTAGMPADQLTAFWREALEPGITRWVRPIGDKSDLIIEVGEGHDVLSVSVGKSCDVWGNR